MTAKTARCAQLRLRAPSANGSATFPMCYGSEFDCKPGDVSLLPSGHDAWTVGDEPAVVVDFQGMIDYATAGHSHD
jgi:hypothetical protein